jgi:peptidoglycan/LPS O-acetylase OafA/YrhL
LAKVFTKGVELTKSSNLLQIIPRILKLKLTRITDGRKIIPEIEGLRFISILLVVLSHIYNNTVRVYPAYYQPADSRLAIFLEECGAGVNIFFFISGFILAIPFLNAFVHQKQKVSLKHYYYRRLTRIEPPYIIALIIFLPATIFILQQPFSDAIKHFAASAVYMHSILYDHISTINPVAWTLEIEIQYYLLAPLMAITFFFKNTLLRRSSLLALFIVSGSLYSRNYSFFEAHHLSKSLVAYLSIFITGILFADWYLSNKKSFSGKKYLLLDITGIAALFCIITLSGFADMGYRLLLFACYGILFISIFKGTLLNKLLTKKWIIIIGGMCYSIYLMHYAVIYFITQRFTKNILSYNFPYDIFIQAIIIIPFVLIVSVVFFVLFERPFMDIQWPQKTKIFFKKL